MVEPEHDRHPNLTADFAEGADGMSKGIDLGHGGRKRSEMRSRSKAVETRHRAGTQRLKEVGQEATE